MTVEMYVTSMAQPKPWHIFAEIKGETAQMLCDERYDMREDGTAIRLSRPDGLCPTCVAKEQVTKISEIRREMRRLQAWLATMGHRSNSEGNCRHGTYVGGSGPDYLCGPCEDRSIFDEIEELNDELSKLTGRA